MNTSEPEATAAGSTAGAVLCDADFNYMPASDSGAGPVAVTATIHDARRAALPGWEVCGFELMRHPSAVADWEDDAGIESVHYPEVAALARRLTGCDHALVSSHICRNPEQAARHADLGPIAFVHSDFATSYGDLLRDIYRAPADSYREESRNALQRAGIDGEAVAAARRLLILQFWRNTGPPKMDLPLAFCDTRTVMPDELRVLRVTDYAGGGFDFEALGIAAPEDPRHHRWYTFPELTRDEVVAFRTYDSALVDAGGHFWTPHSAFRDPDVVPGRPSRRSIELRATCLFL